MLKRFKLSLETSIRREVDDEPERSTFSRDRAVPFDARDDAVDLAYAMMDAIAATTTFRATAFVAMLADIAADRIEGGDELSDQERAFIKAAQGILERKRAAVPEPPPFDDPFRVPAVSLKPKQKS